MTDVCFLYSRQPLGFWKSGEHPKQGVAQGYGYKSYDGCFYQGMHAMLFKEAPHQISYYDWMHQIDAKRIYGNLFPDSPLQDALRQMLRQGEQQGSKEQLTDLQIVVQSAVKTPNM